MDIVHFRDGDHIATGPECLSMVRAYLLISYVLEYLRIFFASPYSTFLLNFLRAPQYFWLGSGLITEVESVRKGLETKLRAYRSN